MYWLPEFRGLIRFVIGDLVHVGLQKGFMSLPDDPAVPLLLIGPGTGVAPMRSFIQERISKGTKGGGQVLSVKGDV